MDYEEKKRREFIRVLITEIGMVIATLAIVVVATLAAMGFFISSDGDIKQSGLMQLHSIPTGATVELDGNTLFSRTNLSRTMSAGEHTIKLTRDNYDSWEKTITMRSGILMRLYYPRLFLQNRTPETVLSLPSTINSTKTSAKLAFYSPSRSGNYILYAFSGDPTWHLLDLRGDDVKHSTLDLSKILPDVTQPTKTTSAKSSDTPIWSGEVLTHAWSGNDEKLLLSLKTTSGTEWLLLNLRTPADSVNLTKLFGQSFAKLVIIDDAASRLYAFSDHQIRRIDVPSSTISKVLASNVNTFATNGANFIYLTEPISRDSGSVRQIATYKDNEDASVVITELPASTATHIALARYYDEDYICYTSGTSLSILYGALPSSRSNNGDLRELKTLLSDYELPFIPSSFTLSPDDSYLIAAHGKSQHITHLDHAETFTYDLISNSYGWLDPSLLYAIKDHEILVWDYDGTNQRNLSTSVTAKTSALDFPVTITANNRWLYYLSGTSDAPTLTREKIRD